MKNFNLLSKRILGLLPLSAVLAGCLVSGTFVIVEDFTFTAGTGFYAYPVDLTGNDIYEDHKDDIDFIDEVGLEFTITSTEPTATTFAVYVDDVGSNHGSEAAVIANATKIFEITVPGNATTTFEYEDTVNKISNLEILKNLVKSGSFDYYGTSSSNSGDPYDVTNGKVIITVSASST